MATQTVKMVATSGLTGPVTMKLFTVQTDTIIQSVTATAGTNDPSYYTASYLNAPAARYRVVLFDNATPVASDFVTLTLATSTFSVDGLSDVPATRSEATADKNEILTRGSTGPWTTGGAGAVTITPITSTVGAGVVSSESITYYIGEGKDATITVVDGDGNAIDMTLKTLVMIVENKDKTDYFTVSDTSITKTGLGGNVLTITIPAASITREGSYNYSVRDAADPYRVWARGVLVIAYATQAG